MSMGKVFLVGAGPGDPGLLTVKACYLLRHADVVMYDRLVNPAILANIGKQSQLVYVGKEEGQHTIPQEQINEMLYQYAQRHAVVVRLKGGDPFLFGRGGEEALYLRERGVEFEIVPGITSALSVPAYAGIPVTHRGMAAMCSIITGHLAKDDVGALPWDAMAKMETLIFLMAVGSRQAIARALINAGRDAQEPVAFIEQGTLRQQRVLRATLGEVAEDPPAVFSPAIFLVGKVSALHEEIAWFQPQSMPFSLEHTETRWERSPFREKQDPSQHIVLVKEKPEAMRELPSRKEKREPEVERHPIHWKDALAAHTKGAEASFIPPLIPCTLYHDANPPELGASMSSEGESR